MYTVMVGTHDLTKPGASFHRVDVVKRHENFNAHYWSNDIAIMHLRDKFEFNEKVQPIELAKDEIPDNKTLFFTGWGRISEVGSCSYGHRSYMNAPRFV